MGLTVVQEDNNVHLTCSKKEGQAIDALVLTETKLIPQQHRDVRD